MKPFSKNLFSQTPVAFGWLPEEAINLDISMCVRTCLCGHVCVCALLEYEWEIFFFVVALFYHTRTQAWAKADQLESVQTCSDATPRISAD